MRGLFRRIILLSVLLVVLLAGIGFLRGALAAIAAQELPERVEAPTLRDPPTGIGENLSVRVAVLGPGDELYFWWGHIAIIIEDSATGRSDFFDYGLFSFDQQNFFANFALGRLIYSTGVSATWDNLAGYMLQNRDVVLYTLDIPPDAREMILRQARWDVLPGNRDYLYHHFHHNCATPLIGLIDMATGGQFSERFMNEPARHTFRGHVRRHTWHSPFIDWILNFWMGQDIDRPITAWDEMFLPSEVARNIADFEFVDTDGVTRRLVSHREEVFLSTGRPAVLDEPRLQWPRQLGFSLFLCALLALLFLAQARTPPGHGRLPAVAQVSLGIFHSICGLVLGGAGLVLFFMANFTEHDYTFSNANLLFASPLLLALVPLGLRYASAGNFGRRARPELAIRTIWFLSALGVTASMLMRLSSRFWQDNLTDQLLVLPLALVLSLEPAGLKRVLGRVFWARRVDARL